jgi:hypothetical protein
MASVDLIALGVDLVKDMERRGVCVRLLGSVAVVVLCADALASEPVLRRVPRDIDLAGYSHQSDGIDRTLVARDFEPAKEFNFVNAGRRLIYFRRSDGVKIDIFLDEFRMCHQFSLTNRLKFAPLTLSLTDLLLTKLQVIEFTRQDIFDSYAILLQPAVSIPLIDPRFAFDEHEIVRICSRDWGWFRTVSGNLALLSQEGSQYMQPNSVYRVSETLNRLTHAIRDSRKSIGWQIRALIGERWDWYSRPEEPMS